MQPKTTFSKPMSTADSTLMMLLSLNFLLLVFFVLLNSMATKDKAHSDRVMAQVADGYGLPTTMVATDGSGKDALLTAWRAAVVGKIQGVATSRLDLLVSPQQGSAGKVDIDMPLSALFDKTGKLIRPDVVRNIDAAAGRESYVVWQVMGTLDDAVRMAVYASALAVVTESGRVEVVRSDKQGLRVIVTPGAVTPPSMGLKVQQVGEAAGGTVQGLQDKVSPRE